MSAVTKLYTTEIDELKRENLHLRRTVIELQMEVLKHQHASVNSQIKALTQEVNSSETSLGDPVAPDPDLAAAAGG